MTRLYILTAAGIVGPIALAALVAWFINRSQSLRCWIAGHRWREIERWGVVTLGLRIRRALALPVYMVALILDFASGALGRLAAWIAGDDWPG